MLYDVRCCNYRAKFWLILHYYNYLCSMKLCRSITFVLVLILPPILAACGGASTASRSPLEKPRRILLHDFQPPQPPFHLDQTGQLDYLCRHYWDRFDFSDTLALASIDTGAMLRHFSLFSALVSENQGNATPMDSLFARASSSRPMLDMFLFLAEKVLHDPNSPYRNDELYIPVLERQLATEYYDSYERMIPEYDLQLARQNRIGRPANDFAYATIEGRRSTLYATEAEYLLIFFNNPDCAMCKELREQIGRSEVLTEALRVGRLKVLALYPDEDLTAWRAYQGQIPPSWINARDPQCRIREENLYDIKAIPSLYLLDQEKRVLVKDATIVEQIEAYL